MIKTVSFMLFALVLEAIGVVLLSKGLKEVGDLGQIAVGEILRVHHASAVEAHNADDHLLVRRSLEYEGGPEHLSGPTRDGKRANSSG